MLFAWYAQGMFKGSDIVSILLFLCVCKYLPDSGKLQGRKLSRIGEKHDFHRENLCGLLTFAAPKDTTPPHFAGENFCD